MVRFVDLGRQVEEDMPMFAFFNTVTDQFMSFNGEEAFASVEDFKNAVHGPTEVSRYISLIPQDWGHA